MWSKWVARVVAIPACCATKAVFLAVADHAVMMAVPRAVPVCRDVILAAASIMIRQLGASGVVFTNVCAALILVMNHDGWQLPTMPSSSVLLDQ